MSVWRYRMLFLWIGVYVGSISLLAQTSSPSPSASTQVSTPLAPDAFEQRCRQIRGKADTGLPHLSDPVLQSVLDPRCYAFLQTQLPNATTFEQGDEISSGLQSLLSVYGSKVGDYPAETTQILRARMMYLISLEQAFSNWLHKAPPALTQAPEFNQRRANLRSDMNNGLGILSQLVGGRAAERGVSIEMRRDIAQLLIEIYPKAKMMTDSSLATGLHEAAISDPDETVQNTLRKVFGS
ncbi:MAG: hypothetical protein JO308_06525 [Verrucomicrobia bacterium]|nr:hypothetical protein [Verrucomicrobiota bacterium]